ncbi:MAG TPA: pyruvate, water dikinase regulatory protein [Gammaproteobacteria bacterium]
MTKQSQRTVFFLSDRTGITAETLGRSMMTQFDGVDFHFTRLPFLDSAEKMAEAVARINSTMEDEGSRPIIFSTLVNSELLEQLRRDCKGLVLDFFDAFNAPLEAELGIKASHVMGRSHGMGNFAAYTARIEALNYSLSNDDGITTKNFNAADIILIGVSRSGKTPTSLFLALQFGIHAANYPLTEEDLHQRALPESLRPFRDKLFGLTIDPARLQQIRNERRPNSRYANAGQCQKEVDAVESLYRKEGIRFLNTTHMSIEEISTTILQTAGLKRRLLG